MKGVMMPEVSAGSNHVGASEMWAPQIISPAGASERPAGASAVAAGDGPRIANVRTNSEAKRPRTCFMEASVFYRAFGSLFSFQSDIFVGGRKCPARDEAEPRFGHTRTMRVDEAELPDWSVEGLLEDELLDAVQCRLAALAVEVAGLLAKEPIDVGIAAINVGSAADREHFQPRGRVAEGAADAVGEILQLLFLVGLEEGGALERTEPHADADRLQIAHERLAHRRSLGLAPEVSSVEAVGIPGLGQKLLGARRIERVRRSQPGAHADRPRGTSDLTGRATRASA